MISILLTIFGLALFETVSSIDNAIINAEVLSTMSQKARRWFLVWGLLIAVFLVRGLLPWLIVWIATPGIGPIEALVASFSGDRHVMEAIEASAPLLLSAGGTFLLFLFCHWLFLEEKTYGLPGERFFHQRGLWFYAAVSILLCGLVWLAVHTDPLLAFGCVIGSTAFFITHGFKQQAEHAERHLSSSTKSDFAKILYLEVIDATFSVDGVLGAFAFTLSVPIILLGNGLGALIVRKLTMSNIERVKKYVFLKNGAMYSVLGLGVVMMLDAFGVHVPTWATPVMTFVIIGFFFQKSIWHKSITIS